MQRARCGPTGRSCHCPVNGGRELRPACTGDAVSENCCAARRQTAPVPPRIKYKRRPLNSGWTPFAAYGWCDASESLLFLGAIADYYNLFHVPFPLCGVLVAEDAFGRMDSEVYRHAEFYAYGLSALFAGRPFRGFADDAPSTSSARDLSGDLNISALPTEPSFSMTNVTRTFP